MDESTGSMIIHSAIIWIISFIVLSIFNKSKAMNRSIIFASLTLIYMLAFGHKLPSLESLKKNIL